MTSVSPSPVRPVRVEWPHHIRVAVTAALVLSVTGFVLWQGLPYYRLPLTERPFHPGHLVYRPSGNVGLRLGFLAGAGFLGLYLYPLRKRFRWLQRFGKTRRWLDVHVLFGLSAPLLVTLHSSFKFQGLAGMAYWIMIAIVVSGIVGRYLYSQIPRSVSAAELSVRELEEQSGGFLAGLSGQSLVQPHLLRRVLAVPTREQVESLSLAGVLFGILRLDLLRPFRVAAARRSALPPRQRLLTLGGFLPSRNATLESLLRSLRREAWLLSKIAFLQRAGRIFHLWHVVHRPFSWSFAILVVAHVVLVLLMGFVWG
jgi:hypothetical protein